MVALLVGANNTATSLPQYCPPMPACEVARLSGGNCPPQGWYEPVLCDAGFYCPLGGKEKIPCMYFFDLSTLKVLQNAGHKWPYEFLEP
jgi:hypothetical protein